MRMAHLFLVVACLSSWGGFVEALPVVPPSAEAWTAEKNALLTKLQTMAHGRYSDDEWQTVYSEMYGLLQQAEEAGNHEGIVDLSLLLARVQSEMRQRHTDALYTLSNLKDEYRDRKDVPVNRIYMGLAEVHGRLGNGDAIEALIEEFSSSAHYDAEDYAVSGGDDPSTPVQVVRPGTAGNASITVSTMKRFLREAALSSGKSFPEFQTQLVKGGSTSLDAYRGKVLLVDCWVEAWPSWKNNLPYLVSSYDKYHAAGFDILGVYLGSELGQAMKFAKTNGMSWPQADSPRNLARLVGVIGEATSFLVGKNGQIIGRNLSIPEMIEKVRGELELTE